MPTTELTYDPYDPVIDVDPHPTWRRLRDEAPLYRNDKLGFYALSRYDDVLPALTDWRTYSSGRGTVLELIDPLAPDTEGYTEGQMMIFTDPPFHDTLRGLVSRSFTPRRVGSMEARVHELCRAALDEVAGAGSSGFDYLGDFAGHIPAMVIGELLGIPQEDQRQLGHWTDQFMHYDPDLDPPGEVLGVKQLGPVRVAGMKNLVGYLEATIDARTAQPADDMISALLAAEVPLAWLMVAFLLLSCLPTSMTFWNSLTKLLSRLPVKLARSTSLWTLTKCSVGAAPFTLRSLLLLVLPTALLKVLPTFTSPKLALVPLSAFLAT